MEFSQKGNCFQKKCSQEHHFWNQFPILLAKTVEITQSEVSMGMIFPWWSKFLPPVFWLLLECLFSLCRWCSEVLKIFSAYDIVKVMSFKLWSPRADDQVKVVLSPVCPSVSLPASLGDLSLCAVAASWPTCSMLWVFFSYNMWNPFFVPRPLMIEIAH